MIIDVDGQTFDVPDDATPDEIDALTRPPQSEQSGLGYKRWIQKAGEGFVPGYNRLVAATQAATDAISGRGSFLTNYGETLSGLQSESRKTQAEHPWLSAGAQTGGAVLSAALAAPARGVEYGAQALEGVPALARALTGVRQGAGIGAAYGAGEAPADAGYGTVASHAAGGALVGGALGGAAGALIPSHVPSNAPSADAKVLRRWAERAAVRSANADRTATKRAFGRPADREAVSDTGAFLLDEKIPLRTPAKMQEGLEKIIASEGPSIGGMPKAASTAGAQFDLEAATLRTMDSPQMVKLAQDTEGRPTYTRIAEFMLDQVQRLGNKATPEDGHKLRMRLDELAKWDKTRPDEVNWAWRAARDAVNVELEASMERAGMGPQWRAANARFAQAKVAKDLADVGAERRIGNKLGSLNEWGSGLIGGGLSAATGNPGPALMGAGAVGLNRFGMPVAARTLNAASRLRIPIAGDGTGTTLTEAMDIIAALRNPSLALTPAHARRRSDENP